ncbi:chorismate-binding protein [Paractinoplanes aksuensis]|uniref:chorismate-binding protein n=1 Tax=Paractinoplanes aksuensis TaxID=2939490 RepID=UPI003F68FAD5
MAGGPLAASSPTPAIPDVYAVIYEHLPSDSAPPSQPVTPWWQRGEASPGMAGAAADGDASEQDPSSPPPDATPARRQSPDRAPGHPDPSAADVSGSAGSCTARDGTTGPDGSGSSRAWVAEGGSAPGCSAPGNEAWALGEWTPSWTPAEHAAAVSRVREAIGRGDVYQVNVVGHTSAPYTGDPVPALHRVATLPGARYGGVLVGDGWALATASPETLVEVRDGRVVTRPIKGTRPATAEGRRELLASTKERSEHVMIVDLSRNDLARLPGVGPVEVEELFAVRQWSGLWQAESVVSAPITGELDLASLLRTLVPGGSVTGAPKIAALAEIARLEPVGRGVSMAAVGWIGPDHVDLGLTIRTVAVDGTHVHAWAGGGIVWDSDPEAEVAEAAAKLAPIKAALAGPPAPTT